MFSVGLFTCTKSGETVPLSSFLSSGLKTDFKLRCSVEAALQQQHFI
jgi:hypothetical protein